MRILVAEDDPVLARVMAGLMKLLGRHDLAENGQRALELYHAAIRDGDPYDVVFLDVMMPVMDGQTALREMRKLESDLGVPAERLAKIVMTTALDDKENVLRAFREQADGYLVKPINSGMIVGQLKKMGLLG